MSEGWSYAALNPDPGKQRGRGQETACRFSVALSDHGDRFGQAISRVCTDKMCATWGNSSWTTNSGMEATHNHQGILSEERMIERVHGIDRHKSFSTISVLNRPGEAVVLEASTGSFWWADQIEAKGARCFVEQDGQA